MWYKQGKKGRLKEMAKTMQIMVSIEDENGEVIVSKGSKRRVPYIEEIDAQGFRAAFHDLETAFLESRKEVCDSAVSEYLEGMSLKKQERNRTLER